MKLNTILIIAPFVLHGILMMIDEFYYHVRRGLPRWERAGHPLDTLSVIACYAGSLYLPFRTEYVYIFSGLAVFSSLFITKDEFVHHQYCSRGEQWLHSVLFVLHPVILAGIALVWFLQSSSGNFLAGSTDPSVLLSFLKVQSGLVILFLLYQIIYWTFYGKKI